MMKILGLALLVLFALELHAAPTAEQEFLGRWRAIKGPVVPTSVAQFAKSLSRRRFSAPVILDHGINAIDTLQVLGANDPAWSKTDWNMFPHYTALAYAHSLNVALFNWLGGRQFAVVHVDTSALPGLTAKDPIAQFTAQANPVKPVFIVSGNSESQRNFPRALVERLYSATPIHTVERADQKVREWNTIAMELRRAQAWENVQQQSDELIVEMSKAPGGISIHRWTTASGGHYLEHNLEVVAKNNHGLNMRVARVDHTDLTRTKVLAETLGEEAVVGGKLSQLIRTGMTGSESSIGTAILYISPSAIHGKYIDQFVHLTSETVRRLKKYSLKNPEHKIRIIVEESTGTGPFMSSMPGVFMPGPEYDLKAILQAVLNATEEETKCGRFLTPDMAVDDRVDNVKLSSRAD